MKNRGILNFLARSCAIPSQLTWNGGAAATCARLHGLSAVVFSMTEHIQQTAVVVKDVAPRDLPMARHRSGLTSRAYQATRRPCCEEIVAGLVKTDHIAGGEDMGYGCEVRRPRSSAFRPAAGRFRRAYGTARGRTEEEHSVTLPSQPPSTHQ